MAQVMGVRELGPRVPLVPLVDRVPEVLGLEVLVDRVPAVLPERLPVLPVARVVVDPVAQVVDRDPVEVVEPHVVAGVVAVVVKTISSLRSSTTAKVTLRFPRGSWSLNAVSHRRSLLPD